MGVKGLWTELNSYRHETSLTDISIREGVIENVANVRGFRVGIDASIWIRRGTAHLYQAWNAVLATLFIHIMRLFSMTAIIPYFVFDGPDRPGMKRQKHVQGNDHWITKKFKALLTIMGIAWKVAPGEAEAELAWLCADGWIDAVMTEDVDVAIFGATRIFRIDMDNEKIVNKSATDFKIFDFKDFSHLQPCLLLIAIFSGGDYGAGIPNVAIAKGRVLAEMDISQQLVNVGASLSKTELFTYLVSWRQEFRAAVAGHPSRAIRNLVIPNGFPSADIVYSYMHPLVSRSSHPHILSWDSHPDLGKLTEFVAQHFSWGSDFTKIFDRFKTAVFPGLAIRELLQAQLEKDGNLVAVICPVRVLGAPSTPRSNQSARERTHIHVLLQIPFDSIIANMAASAILGGVEDDLDLVRSRASRVIKAWIPRALYEYVLAPFVATSTFNSCSIPAVAAGHQMISHPRQAGVGRADRRFRVEEYRTMSGQEVLEFFTDSEGEY